MTMNWSEAIYLLSGERTRAEILAGLLKKYGSEAERDQGALLYGEAKADFDAVIDGLLVVLAQRSEPANLPKVEARIQRAVESAVKLGDHIRPLLPDTTGQKSGLGDILGKPFEVLLRPFTEAVAAIWKAAREDNAQMRATIRTQLEGTRWRDFAVAA